MDDTPCEPWPYEPAWCPPGTAFPADREEWTPIQVAALGVASETLWRLTAGRYGLCAEKVRPCAKPCVGPAMGTSPLFAPAVGGGWVMPALVDGAWLNIWCCNRSGAGCGCTHVSELLLPGPVHEVTEVRQDGTVLAATVYQLRRTRTWGLVRVDGKAWPLCQDLEKPDSEPGTLSVSYRRGLAVPPGGVRAVSVLAGEIAKQAAGQKCRLPSRVQTINREGVTMTLLDPQDWLEAGRTGLEEVDTWLGQVNPRGHRSRPLVWTPDLPQYFTTGGGL